MASDDDDDDANANADACTNTTHTIASLYLLYMDWVAKGKARC